MFKIGADGGAHVIFQISKSDAETLSPFQSSNPLHQHKRCDGKLVYLF